MAVLRDMVGGAARLSAGIWREVANVIDPQPEEGAKAPDEAVPESATRDDAKPDDVVPGSVLVPVDTWTRVLDQLSNLHQAGQDLAEARERAARAETESGFLREQLAELRNKPGGGSPAKAKSPEEPTSPDPLVESAPSRVRFARGQVLNARRRVSSWLQPGDQEEGE